MAIPAGDDFSGCLLGLALGDALGAPFEGGALERLIWKVIGKTRDGRMRWTDDTRMSLDLAESLIANGRLDQDDLARRFAASYRWSRGYGPGAAKLLKRIRRGEPWSSANRSVFKEGSFGNGAAMRAPVIGLFYAPDPAELELRARESARVTHAHPLAEEGAVLIAAATAAALAALPPAAILDAAAARCSLPPLVGRLELARQWLRAAPPPEEVAGRLGNGIAAADSCVTALYLALRFHGSRFEELCSFTAKCGGDTDTIGAMAGAIWGAANGGKQLPDASLQMLEGAPYIEEIAEALRRTAQARWETAARPAEGGGGENG